MDNPNVGKARLINVDFSRIYFNNILINIRNFQVESISTSLPALCLSLSFLSSLDQISHKKET